MKRFGLVAVLVAGTFFAAAGAQAASVTSGSIGNARLCTDSACTNPTMNLVSGSSGPISGTFSINVALLQLEFDLTLASAVLDVGSGAADNGITSLTLQNVRYQGTAPLTLALGDPNGPNTLPNLWNISGGSASINGGATTNPASPAVSIAASNVFVGGSCSQSTGNVATCGIIFSSGNYSLEVNGQTRYMANTLNVAPEPAAFALLGLGLAALAGLRARRS